MQKLGSPDSTCAKVDRVPYEHLHVVPSSPVNMRLGISNMAQAGHQTDPAQELGCITCTLEISTAYLKLRMLFEDSDVVPFN